MEWEAQTGTCQCFVCAFETSCGCTALDLPDVEGNDGADRPVGKTNIKSDFHFARYEMLRSLILYMLEQSQGHHTIYRLEERGMGRGSTRRSSLKGRERAIVNETNIGTVSKATLGEPLREEVERIWVFSSHVVVKKNSLK